MLARTRLCTYLVLRALCVLVVKMGKEILFRRLKRDRGIARKRVAGEVEGKGRERREKEKKDVGPMNERACVVENRLDRAADGTASGPIGQKAKTKNMARAPNERLERRRNRDERVRGA